MVKMTIGQEIALDRAMDGKKAIVACSGLLVSCFLLGVPMGSSFGAIAISNVVVFILLLSSFLWTDHHSWRSNLIILVSYLGMTAVEYVSFGLPGLLLSPGEGISRGSLMDVIIISLPYFYIGLRLMMAIPLLVLFLLTRRIENDQKSSPRDM